MESCEKLVEKHLALEKRQKNMELFRTAEKEYLEYVKQQSGAQACEQQADTEVPNQQFCFRGLKHQCIDIGGERTCNECGLVFGSTPYVTPYAGVNSPEKSSVSFRFDNFCQKKNITAYGLLRGRTREVLEIIEKVCDAEKPRGKRLPNLNSLTYQVCRRLDVEIDESLLRISKGKIPHDRCKGIFKTLGWEYIE